MKPTLNIFLTVIIFLSVLSVRAQESYYRVYQFETPYKGHLELTNWTTYIANSDQSAQHFKKDMSRNKLFAYSAEAEYGIGDHFVLAGYADFEQPHGEQFNFTRSRVEARYRFGERYDHFINTAAYLEYYFPNNSYTSSQEVEARFIMDKDIEDFRIVLNPTLSKYINGDEDKNWQLGVSAGLYYRRGRFFQPGIEYYENFYDHMSSIFPAINMNLTGSIVWNIGVGYGINKSNDNLIVKSILQFDLQAIRPTRLMRKKF